MAKISRFHRLLGKSGVGLGLVLSIFLTSCDLQPTPTLNGSSSLTFTVDPQVGIVSLAQASGSALDVQTATAPGENRVLVNGVDLELVSYSSRFESGNRLIIEASFKNITSGFSFLQPFFFTATTTNIISSTEPTVTDADIGGDGRLGPGETTSFLKFEVVHKGQKFSYTVNANAGVEESTSAKSQIEELERQGKLPQLNRSTSLTGPDANTNGIRDDVDAFIDTLLMASHQKLSAAQLAKGVQASLVVDITNDSALREAVADISNAVNCMSRLFPAIEERASVATAVEAVTANTIERTNQYIKFNNALSGTVSRLPEGDTCTFTTAPTFSAQQVDENNLCKPGGYVIGFFNGVWNTSLQAWLGMTGLRDSFEFGTSNKYKDEDLDWELFYNQSGGTLEDLAEVFTQRSRELDGALSNRWELFWEAISSSSSGSSLTERFTTTIRRVNSTLNDLIATLYSSLATETVDKLASSLSNPPTGADYATQHTRIKALALEKKKLLFVAHSQGNLFVNQAYDAALTVTDAESVKVVHIAPASPTTRGNHILADVDIVINGLRAQGFLTIPESNVFLPLAHLLDDPSGHTLIGTYLAPNRATLGEVKRQITSALDSLETPTTEGSQGFFTVTLTWDGSGDVDLHVFEPSGSHVYYSATQGGSGYLDVDNTSGFGPEHYYATCEAERLVTGSYRIGINNYRGATGRIATVQVATAAGGEIFSRQLGVGSERGSSGNSSPTSVVTVTVSKDENGKFKTTVP